LCYGPELCASEACSLRLGDVDAGRSLRIVRGGKFDKSRLVPHGPRTATLVN
jgi:integrase